MPTRKTRRRRALRRYRDGGGAQVLTFALVVVTFWVLLRSAPKATS